MNLGPDYSKPSTAWRSPEARDVHNMPAAQLEMDADGVADFIQRVYRIFSLLRFHRFYSKSEFWVKLSEISRKNEWTWVELSEIESNWIKINWFLLNLTQFHSISLMFTRLVRKISLNFTPDSDLE